MAASSQPVFTTENENFFRFTSLLLDLGAQVMREVLKSYFPNSTFDQYLKDPNVYSSISGLLKRNVLRPEQTGMLYPTADIMKLDMTLLYTLIRNLNINKQAVDLVWTTPQPTDTSIEADVARIRLARNMLHGHVSSSKMDPTLYKSQSTELEKCYLRIILNLPSPQMSHAELQTKILKVQTDSIDTSQQKELIDRLETYCMDIPKALETIKDEFSTSGKKPSGKGQSFRAGSISGKEDGKGVLHMIQKLVLKVSNSSVRREKMEQRIRETESFLDVHRTEFEKYGILPSSYEKALNILRKKKYIFLSGTAGSGKTFMGKTLLNDFCKTATDSSSRGCDSKETQAQGEERKPIFISSVSEWKEMVDTEKKLFVYVDDFLGRYGLRESDVNEWCSLADILLSVLLQGNLYMVFTIRRNVWEKVVCGNENTSFSTDSLKRFLNTDCLHDLSSADAGFSYNERLQMIKKYKEVDSIKIEEQTMKDICTTTNETGFPQSCKMMKSTATETDMVRVFKQPDEFLLHEMKSLCRKNTMQYTAFVIIAFLGGKLNMAEFETDSEVVKQILQSLKMEYFTDSDLEMYLKSALGSFLAYEEDSHTYTFSHDTIHAIVLKSFGDVFPELTLRICPLDILSKVCYTGKGADDPSIVADTWVKLFVNKANYGIVGKRFLTELTLKETKLFRTVSEALVWNSHDFAEYVFNETNGLTAIAELLDVDGDSLLVHSSAVGNAIILKECLLLGRSRQTQLEFQHQLHKALLSACENNKKDVVSLLLEDIPQIPDEAMFAAAKAGNVAVLEYLYKNGGNIHCNSEPKMLSSNNILGLENFEKMLDLEGQATNLLDLACLYGRQEMVMFLTRHGKFKPSDVEEAITLAAAGGNIDILKHILSYLSLNTMDDEDASSLLTVACLYNRRKMVEYLIEFYPGALKAESDFPPICAAAAGGDVKLLKFLIERGKTFFPESDATILHFACMAGKKRTAEYIIKKYPDLLHENEASMLYFAAKIGDVDILELFIQHGVDPTSEECDDDDYDDDELEDGDEDIKGNTILHVACRKRNTKMIKYIMQKCPQLVKKVLAQWDPKLLGFLVKNGLDPAIEIDKHGSNVFHLVCAAGDKSTVNYILNSFPYLLSTVDKCGYNAIHKAAMGEDVTILKVLVQRGMDPTVEDWNGNNVLHIACREGNESIAKYILHEYPALHKKRNNKGETVLHKAAKGGERKVMEELLKCSKDGAAEDHNGRNILHIASLYGKRDIIKCIMYSYPDLAAKLVSRADREGRKAIHLAAKAGQVKMLQYLLNFGIWNYKERDKKGRNVLHIATFEEKEELVRVLIREHPDLVNEQDSKGHTAQQIAVKRRRRNILDCFNQLHQQIQTKQTPDADLLQARDTEKWQNQPFLPDVLKRFTEFNRAQYSSTKGNVTSQNSKDSSYLHDLCMKGNENEARMVLQMNPHLLHLKDSDGRTAMHYAAMGGHVAILKLLVKFGLNYDVKDSLNRTILHAACLESKETVINYIYKRYPELLFDIDPDGNNIMHFVTKHAKLDALKYFVNVGMDQSVENNNGSNILLVACEFASKEIVQYIANTCKVLLDKRDKNGQSAVHVAAKRGDSEILTTLIQLGLSPKTVDSGGRTILHLACYPVRQYMIKHITKRYPDLLQAEDNNGETALHYAAKGGDVVIVQGLIKRGANPTALSRHKRSALHLAIEAGKSSTTRFFTERYPVLVNSEDEDGWYPIHIAAYYDHLNILEELVEKGANTTSKNKIGETALELARQKGCSEIVQYLERK